MNKVRNTLVLGLISGFLGEFVIMMINRLFVRLGLVQSSLNTMSLQAVKSRKWIPLTMKNDIWLSRGISTFFCISGGIVLTYFLSFMKRLCLMKGFIIGSVGGLIPHVFKELKLIKDFKNPLSKFMCLISHGFFGLTVALVIETLGDRKKNK